MARNTMLALTHFATCSRTVLQLTQPVVGAARMILTPAAAARPASWPPPVLPAHCQAAAGCQTGGAWPGHPRGEPASQPDSWETHTAHQQQGRQTPTCRTSSSAAAAAAFLAKVADTQQVRAGLLGRQHSNPELSCTSAMTPTFLQLCEYKPVQTANAGRPKLTHTREGQLSVAAERKSGDKHCLLHAYLSFSLSLSGPITARLATSPSTVAAAPVASAAAAATLLPRFPAPPLLLLPPAAAAAAASGSTAL